MESSAVKNLLSLSSKPYDVEMMKGLEDFSVAGWQKVRPKADYDITLLDPARITRQRTTHHHHHLQHRKRRSSSLASKQSPPELYMSGDLDESYSYVYREGLSKRGEQDSSATSSSAPFPLSSPPYHLVTTPASATTQHKFPSVVQLDTTLPYSRSTKEQVEMDLARLVALKLKPELLVEQIVIENRLRTMGPLNTEPLGYGHHGYSVLDLDHIGSNSGPPPNSVAAVRSMPALSGTVAASATTHRRKGQRWRPKPHPSLAWCTLNPDSIQAGNNSTSSNNHTGMTVTTTSANKGGNLVMDGSLINAHQTAGSSNSTRFRLPRLLTQSGQAPNMTPPQQQQQQQRRLMDIPRRQSAVGLPVVSPSLHLGGVVKAEPAEQLWQQYHDYNGSSSNQVKYANKLRSLQWL